MNKYIMRLALISAPLLLSACGENWEMQRTDQILPYGNQRTAGTGVAYMRAKMLPEKELKITQISKADEEEEITKEEAKEQLPPAHALDAEEIFSKQQQKSVSKPNNITTSITDTNNNDNLLIDATDNEEIQSTEIIKNKDENIDKQELSAEDFIKAKPEDLNLKTEDMEIYDIEPLAGNEENIDKIDEKEINSDLFMTFDDFSEMETYENNVSQPSKQIIAPKQDFINLNIDGTTLLDEIYNSEFPEEF